ncbi:MAG: acyltransferase [Candidatus Micrarchaeia archaeon]
MRIIEFWKKYGFIKIVELSLSELSRLVNPIWWFNYLNFKRKCKSFGKNVRIKGDIDARVFQNSEIHIGDNVRLDGNLEIWARENSKIFIGDGTHIEKFARLNAANGSVLKIGKNCYIGRFFAVNCFKKIEIGDECLIAGGFVTDTDHNYKDRIMKEENFVTTPTYIGNNVWLGYNCAILRGSIIGDGSVIGANAVVKGKVPPRSIMIGVPARIIKKR